jgi:1A family penicillin-binding protein
MRPRRIVVLILSSMAAVVLALALGLLLRPGLLLGLPDGRAAIGNHSLASSNLFLDRNGKLLYEMIDMDGGYHRPLPLEEIPLLLRQAVIATEDATFYRNPGVNLKAIVRALWYNLREGRVVSGGSTITQQLARNLLIEPEERYQATWQRKAREAVMAYHLTRTLSKDEILALYLNEIYFGNMAYGVEAAARVYLDKPAAELDLAECALLAGLPQAPAVYNPLNDLPAAKERQRVVLDLMVQAGIIDTEQADLAYQEPLRLVAAPMSIEAPHLVMLARENLTRYVTEEAIRSGGLRIYTTLDLDLQRAAEDYVRYHLAMLNKPQKDKPSHDVHNAAVVVLDAHDGSVRVMVGSPDYTDTSIDGAVNAALALRQPGSAIKPLTYAAALERGFTPATMITDVRTAFTTREGRPYAPVNYDYRFHGPVLLRQALACSYNVVAVKVLDQIGVDALVDMGRRLGISSLNDIDRQGLSLTLGGMEVSLMELTAAYGALARGGLRLEPTIIDRIENSRGEVPYRAPRPSAERVLDERVAYLITDMLADDYARVPAFGEGSALDLPFPAAVKTGTTTDWRDNWTVGYSTDYVAGVWVGNADSEPMQQVSGVSGAAPIWNAVMRGIHRRAPSAFVRPAGIVEREVCATSGLLPGPACSHRRIELFPVEKVPTTTCNLHGLVAIDSATGAVCDTECAPERTTYRRVTFWPTDALAWAEEEGLPLPPATGQRTTRISPQAADRADENALRLSNPDPNSHYLLVPELPPDMQRIEVLAAVPANLTLRELALLVNGRLEHTWLTAPYRTFWPLQEGTFEFQLWGALSEGKTVQSASVRIVVQASASSERSTP